MKNPSVFFFRTFHIAMFIMLLYSCQTSGPNPPDMTGKFKLTFSLKEGTVNKEKINNDIRDAIETAKGEIEKTRSDLEKEFNVDNIDTSTVEGKIEYSAKMFGKSMSQLGLQMSELGKGMGGLVGNIVKEGLNLSDDIFNKIEINVELQEDGDIKADDSVLNIGTSNSSWEVKGGEFILKNRKKESVEIFKITERNSKGFTLEKDNLIMNFNKINGNS